MNHLRPWATALMAVAIGMGAANLASAYTNIMLYSEDFETYPNGYPLTDANVPEFYASSTSAVVQSAEVPPGSTRAAMIPEDVTLSNRYGTNIVSPTNVFIHLEARLVRFESTNFPAVDTNSTALFYVNADGYFVAYDGLNSNWVTITELANSDPAQPVTETNWISDINVYLDFAKRTWSLSTSAVMMAENIGFANSNIDKLNCFDIYNGGGSKTSYVASVAIYDQWPVPNYTLVPTALTNTAVLGQNAKPQTFNIVGTGEGPLNYAIVTNGAATWLAVDSGTGTVTDKNTNVVTLTYNTAALGLGVYNETLAIETAIGTQTVAIAMNIVDLSVDPASLTSGTLYGYAPATQTFVVSQSETGQVTITTNPAVTWMSIDQGIVHALSNTITVSYVTNGLELGTHTTRLYVATEKGGGFTQTVDLAVTVYSRPVPQLGWTYYGLALQKGQQPANTNLTLQNAAGAPRTRMNYTVSSSAAWLPAGTNGVCTNAEVRTIKVPFVNMTTNVGAFTEILSVVTRDAGTVYAPTGTVQQTNLVTVQITIIGPGTPGSLAASDGTDTGGIQVTWTATTNMHHYQLWRGATNAIGQASLLADNLTNLSYYDTAVNPGYKHWYWVRAINAYGGDGTFSAADSGWRYLPAPTGLSASKGTYTNQVALSWTASFGAVTYEIWRSEYNNVGLAALIGTVANTVTTYNDTTGLADKLYYYWVRARTPDMGSYSGPDSGFRAALPKPGKPTASKNTFSTKVRVTWAGVAGATQYEVWRATNNNSAAAAKLGTVTTLGYDDSAAQAGRLYYFWIKARNNQGVSAFSDADTGWRQLPAPANVAATRGTRPYSVRISWTAVPNATAYEVVRGGTAIQASLAQEAAAAMPGLAEAPSLAVAEAVLGDTTLPYFDDNATFAGTPYSYTVRAKNALGSGALSGSVSGFRQVRQATTAGKVMGDYDGDKLADPTLFDPATGKWRILCTVLGEYPLTFGNATCAGVWGDYDGDGLADPMLFSAAGKFWRVMMSAAGYATVQATFGAAGDVYAVADYDGDGKTDPAIFNKTTGVLTALFSGNNYGGLSFAFATGPDYAPVSCDFDGDGKADPAIYSPSASMLRVKLSSAGYADVPVPMGRPGTVFVPGDFDGDGLSELTTYKAATGQLFVKLSSGGYFELTVAFGGPGYTRPVVADFDGDGLLDPAVYGPTKGWTILFSGSGYAPQTDTFSGATAAAVGP